MLQILDELKSLRSDMTTVKSDVTALKNDMVTVKSDVTALKNDMITVKSDITSMQSNMNFMQADITSMQVDIRMIKETMATKEDIVDLPLIARAVLETNETRAELSAHTRSINILNARQLKMEADIEILKNR